jgi:hypothetical protein
MFELTSYSSGTTTAKPSFETLKHLLENRVKVISSFTLDGGKAIGSACLFMALALTASPQFVQGQTATAEASDTQTESKTEKASGWLPNSDALDRVTYDIKYMASDEMGGRKPGTPGIKLCEDFIVAEYKKAGLKPLADGTYFQELEVSGPRKMAKDKTSLKLTGPNDQAIELKIGDDYQMLTSSVDEVNASSEIVFVGYGISAEEHNYDDYANVDVDGKIVVLLRMEPQQTNVDSVFNGDKNTQYSSGRLKAALARENGAEAVLFVNDSLTAPNSKKDELIDATRFGRTLAPFAHVKREVVERMLKDSPLIAPTGEKLTSLKDVEKLIDGNLESISQPIRGWSASLKTEFSQSKVKTSNIVGIIEGEGPNADETIVIGGHYDHLGMGGFGSNAPGRKEIHNGADDNATGTAAVIELARRFAQADNKPGRRLVFICFTAEEMGLIGANYYVENPIFELENTVAMINFDMIGWLRDDRLTLYNWNTSADFAPLFDIANEGIGLDLYKPERGFGGSDHLPFNARRVPNTFIHSGTNNVYHTPEDDFELINCEGALKIIDYSENLVREIASMEKRPKYGKPQPFRFGVRIEEDTETKTVTVRGVTRNSIARKAGVKAGDVFVEFAGETITKRRQVNLLIKKFKGQEVTIKVKRDGEVVELTAKLFAED